jgi:hypothetical protein
MSVDPACKKIAELATTYQQIDVDQQYWLETVVGEIGLLMLKAERAFKDLNEERTAHPEISLDTLEKALSEMSDQIVRLRFDHVEILDAQRAKCTSLLDDVRAEMGALLKRANRGCDLHSLNDKEVRQKVWELTSGRCTYCDCQLENGGTVGASFVVEHVVPRSCGGPDNIANYVPACASCNNSKGDRHVLQFIQTKMDRRRPPLTVVPLPIAAAE